MSTARVKTHEIGHEAAGSVHQVRIPRRWRWVAAIIGVFVVAELAVSFSVDERLRRHTEAAINASLKGYTAHLASLDFDLLGFTITLGGITIVQDAHPKPPVADVRQMQASVYWRSLLRGRLVADFTIDRPHIHVNRAQMQVEAKDRVDLSDKGWQEALEAIYPLKINHFELNGGEVKYIDLDAKRPIELKQVTMVAENIRNVRSPDNVYPSNVFMSVEVFDSGRLRIDGHANFLAEPFAAFDVDFDVAKVPLDALDPLSTQANIRIAKGILGGNGHVEYAPKKRDVHLKKATIDGVQIEYVHTERTQAAEEKRIEKVKDVAEDVSNEPTINVHADELLIRNATLGYKAADERYRVFVTKTNIAIHDVSSQKRKEPARIDASGRFMDAGEMSLKTTLRPVNKTPEFDLMLRIENTPLAALNELFRAYGQFDVVGGSFAFYTELHAKDGQIRGYMKPLFKDMNVYDRRQDRDKPFFNQIYQSIVGGVANLLENRNEDVATRADISGSVSDPNVNSWQVILRLIQNAFVRSILPGFEVELRRASEHS